MSLAKALRRFHAADMAWQNRYLRYTPFHPAFWAHISIYKALETSAPESVGVMLDVGCGLKPYAPVFADQAKAHIGLEYSPESPYMGHRADLFGDASSLPVASSSLDTLLCTEVLEHLEDPQKALDEFYRVLKPGGLLMLTTPFAYPLHEERDYFRYSAKGLTVLLARAGFTVNEVKPLTGSGRTLALLLNVYVLEIGFLWTKWLYPFGVILRPALWALAALVNLAGALADIVLPSDHLAFGHLALARKELRRGGNDR